MHRQLQNLYTLNEHLQHTQQGHMSLYIVPNGKIFDCRQCGVISHCIFTDEFYKNYKRLMGIHNEIDFNTEVSEFILDDENFGLKDIRDFYLEQFDYLQYLDMNLYNLVKNNYLAVDNILVQDLGFVKVSINRAELPAISLPMEIFNNKKMTGEQYKSLIEILTDNTISSQNFEPKRLVKLREKELQLKNIELERLRNTALKI